LRSTLFDVAEHFPLSLISRTSTVRCKPLWRPTVVAVGLAAAAMLAGSAFATTASRVRTALLGLAAAKLLLFWGCVWRDDRFIWVVADTGVAFGLVGLLHALRSRQPGSLPIVAGVALSIAAGLVQASGIDLHPHFNHNDLYHVVQAVAIVAYYRGVRALTDRQ